MPDDLPFGLYERLITASLKARLLQFDPAATKYSTQGLDPAEGHATLARHVEDVVARINFVDDDAPLPPPTVAPDLSSAVATFRLSALTGLVDMLRNEKPVRVTINDQSPGFVFVHTGTELVGEGEKR